MWTEWSSCEDHTSLLDTRILVYDPYFRLCSYKSKEVSVFTDGPSKLGSPRSTRTGQKLTTVSVNHELFRRLQRRRCW